MIYKFVVAFLRISWLRNAIHHNVLMTNQTSILIRTWSIQPNKLFVTDRLIVSALSPQESTFRAHKNWRISRIISSSSIKGGPEVMCIHLIGLDRPSANEDRCLISHQYIVMDRITEPGNSKKSDHKFIDQNSVTTTITRPTFLKLLSCLHV